MRNKYNARKTTLDGYVFDSMREAAHYAELKLRERAGEIDHLEIHPSWLLHGAGGRQIRIRSDGYPNGRKARFTADFAYWDRKRDCKVIVDVKGGKATITEGYKLRRGIFEAMFPHFKVEEVR